MAEDKHEALQNELAFLEAGERFLEESSEANWQNFYAFFKVQIGPVPELEQRTSVSRDYAAPPEQLQRLFEIQNVDNHRRVRWPALQLGQLRLKMNAAVLLLIFAGFLLGILLGLSGNHFVAGTQSVPTTIINNGAVPSLNTVSCTEDENCESGGAAGGSDVNQLPRNSEWKR